MLRERLPPPFERLGRPAYRLHLSHCMLSILAELEDTGPFEELREAYNKVRGKNALEAPAHEEWTMVGFCDHIFCRWACSCLLRTAQPVCKVQRAGMKL